MRNPALILKRILRTEKGAGQTERLNKYFFEVDRSANKIEVRRAVQTMYSVKVNKVNMQRVPGKAKTVRREAGWTPEWKKAIVTLQAGQKIDLTAKV